MLELAVLGLLSEQPLHGYELKKRLSETLGPLWGISFGSLYPALRRFERAGAIEETESVDATPIGNISTGSLDGDLAAARVRFRPRPGRRTRKAYRVTPSGDEMFAELLTDETADDERSFAVEALVLPAPRPRRPPRVPRAPPRRSSPQRLAKTSRTPPPERSIAIPGPSWSTGPSPPNTISNGSTT